MRTILNAAVIAALSVGVLAQDQTDKITLSNGNVITGQIKAMADGKVTINSPLLGDVVVPMSSISDMTTATQVALKTKSEELYNRRVLGMEAGRLKLDGDTSLPLDSLAMINPPAKPEPAWTGSLKLNGFCGLGRQHGPPRGRSRRSTRCAARSTASRSTRSWDYSEDKDEATATWKLNQRRTGGGIKYDYFLSKRCLRARHVTRAR
jgi:hypothetical protein